MKKLIYTLAFILIVHCTLKIDICQAQWVQMSNEMGTTQSVQSFTVSGTNLFAGTQGGGVFLSTNNGTNWAAVNNGLTNLNVMSIATSGTNIFAGTWGGGVFRSNNNGGSWTAVNIGSIYPFIYSLFVSGTNIFAGTYVNGIFLSTDNGGNWAAVNSGLTNLHVKSFLVSGTNLFAGTMYGGVFRSTNNGGNWTYSGLDGSSGLSFTVSGTNIFVGTDYLEVLLSTNNGGNWTRVNSGLTRGAVYSLLVSGTNILAGAHGGVFLSTNNGTNWIEKNQGFVVIPAVNSLLIANDYIFAGTYYQSVWRRPLSELIQMQPPAPVLTSPLNDSIVYVLTPSLEWNAVNGASSYRVQVSPYIDFSSLILDVQNITTTNTLIPEGLLETDSSYYWRANASNEGGTSAWSVTWKFRTYSTPEDKIENTVTTIDSMVAVGILNSGNGNALKSKLNNALEKINQGNNNAAINQLNAFINQVNAFINTGKLTQAQGQLLINAANAVIEQISGDNNQPATEIPKEFKLYQNYPNPFNPTTNIRFDLPKSGSVKLVVFDALGREIATLVNEKLAPGTYEVDWNGSEYPSGVYFYKLMTGDFINVKKMLFVK